MYPSAIFTVPLPEIHIWHVCTVLTYLEVAQLNFHTHTHGQFSSQKSLYDNLIFQALVYIMERRTLLKLIKRCIIN